MATQNVKYYVKVNGQYVETNVKTIAEMVLAADGVTTMEDHINDGVLHVTQLVQDQLTKLALDPNATYATKQELASQTDGVIIVNDIAARDALGPINVGQLVWVLNATGDGSVSSGAAEYLWNDPNWIKVSEAESMDLILQWANIQGKPNSTPSEIDTAVLNSHTHDNEAVLDSLSDSSGVLAYNGSAVGRDEHVIVSDTQPTDQIDGDIWFQIL